MQRKRGTGQLNRCQLKKRRFLSGLSPNPMNSARKASSGRALNQPAPHLGLRAPCRWEGLPLFPFRFLGSPNPKPGAGTTVPTRQQGRRKKRTEGCKGNQEQKHKHCSPASQEARAMQFSSSARAADENVDYLFKVILVGDSNVGKTCVVQHFKSGVYSESQQNTIGVDFTMQVWDTAGQERFRTITQSYYRSAHAAIIAYDLTRRSTFESVPHWIHEIEKYGAANLVIMLIGNKSDLWENRHVLFEDACTLAEKYGLLAVLETSAKESRNIDEVFVLMAKELIARNSLHLYGESIQQGLSQDSSPIIVAQGPRENTRCTC
ncbi:ras-related protein Rab-19 isoform X2 [Mesocricetus auratus]|uniref:Ras-related protein Rab-19 isoform X2 n=1 Tax=Mesocricetus auratus TaxID=10036 RepID=A0ABM2W752_MESAU|nr:ras-related protein Rab-19 isoform X2 [Mesocricetus auratus]